MSCEQQDLDTNTDEKIAILECKLRPATNLHVGRCVEAVQRVLQLQQDKDIRAYAKTVLDDVYGTICKARLPPGKLISPTLFVELLLTADESAPEIRFRHIRLACFAIEDLITGCLRAKISMQKLAGLMTALAAAMQAIPQICGSGDAVRDLLWDYLAKPLLRMASKSELSLANRCYRAVNELLDRCRDYKSLASQELFPLCCVEVLQGAVFDDAEVFQLLWRVVERSYTTLSFDKTRRMIDACQLAFSNQQKSEFKRTSAMMTLASIVDLGKEAMLGHSKGDGRSSLPTIARALIQARQLPHCLNETARQESGLLFEAALGCHKMLEELLNIGKLKTTIRRELQAAAKADGKRRKLGDTQELHRVQPTIMAQPQAKTKPETTVRPPAAVAAPGKDHFCPEKGMACPAQQTSSSKTSADSLSPASGSQAPLQEGTSHWGKECSSSETTFHNTQPAADKEFSPFGAGIADWSSPTSGFYEEAPSSLGVSEELKILEVVPGVVIGKDSVMDDPGFLQDLAPTHIATLAENLLSAGSRRNLSNGIAKLREHEWNNLDAALATFFNLVKDARQKGGRLLVPPGSLAMLIVSAFLVWEERVSDEELISIVNDIEEFLGLQCPPNDILELILAWREHALWVQAAQAQSSSRYYGWQHQESYRGTAV